MCLLFCKLFNIQTGIQHFNFIMLKNDETVCYCQSESDRAWCVFSLMCICVCVSQYLTLESSFEGKDYVCERLLQFLLSEASPAVSDKLSFQLMEALLYRVNLNLFTGRMESALAILQVRPQTHTGLM